MQASYIEVAFLLELNESFPTYEEKELELVKLILELQKTGFPLI